jgi:hypothetical protein
MRLLPFLGVRCCTSRRVLTTKAEIVAHAGDEHEAALLGNTRGAGVVDEAGEVEAAQSELARASAFLAPTRSV